MIGINYENLTISELRVLARSLQIKSPTSKNRATLLNLIDLAKNNKLPLSEVNNGNKGRPTKSRIAINITDSKPLLQNYLNEIKFIQNRLKKLEDEIRKNVE